MANRSTALSLTPEQAWYVIDRLITERRIPRALVEKMSGERDEEIRRLQARLAQLHGESPSGRKRGRARRAPNLSAETQASRRLQGQYLNLIRRVPAAQRPRFQEIAKTKGREAAIRAIRKTLKS